MSLIHLEKQGEVWRSRLEGRASIFIEARHRAVEIPLSNLVLAGRDNEAKAAVLAMVAAGIDDLGRLVGMRPEEDAFLATCRDFVSQE